MKKGSRGAKSNKSGPQGYGNEAKYWRKGNEAYRARPEPAVGGDADVRRAAPAARAGMLDGERVGEEEDTTPSSSGPAQ